MFAKFLENRRARIFARSILTLFLLTLSMLPESAARWTEERDGAPLHGPARMLRNHDGVPRRGLRNEEESDNWSGYVLHTSQTGDKYTSAQGNWVVPGITNEEDPQLAEYSTSWVGIGGGCQNALCTSSDQTLIQLGTEQDVHADGTTDYFAWYELLPQDAITIPNPVQPGDAISASLRCVASCSSPTQAWTLSMTDSTAGWFWTKTLFYSSSLQSAEWIEEAPSSSSGDVFPLANFGIVTFQSVTANGSNPDLSLSNNAIQLNAGYNTGNPSSPANGDSFSVCSGTPATLTPCTFAGGPSPLAAAVLPAGRSITTNSTATAFATIVNGGSVDGTGCGITALSNLPFSYQVTNPATNATIGSANTPVNIPAGGSQSFVISFTPTSGFSPTPIAFNFSCANLPAAANTFDVNTLLLSSWFTPPPDIVALAATTSNDGTLHIPGAAGTGAFAVAAVNVGAGSTLTAQATIGGTSGIPLSVSICETNPTTGQCLSAIGPSVTTTIAAGAEPTFGIFATAGGPVAFSPGVNRIFVRFTDASGTVRGLTSVAVATR